MTKLSICIPTYNRSKCLAELLDSIVAQNSSELEVVVSDDASTDDTPDVVTRYQEVIQQLKFIRQPVNVGLDRNFLEVTNAATGEYVWLMGDDDRLEPDGVAHVLAALQRWPDVVGLTLGVIDYDPAMKSATGLRTMPETQLLTGGSSVFSSIAELLGFMSAMVLNRRKWQQASSDSSVESMKNLYSQVYIAGLAVGESGTWGVLNRACVGFRSDNDQFKRKLGWFDRLKVDVEAYDDIASRLFVNDPVTRRIMRRRIFDSHIIARLVNLQADTHQTAPKMAVAFYLLKRYGSIPKLWTRGLPILFMPKSVLRTLRVIYKRYSSSSGSARARKMTRT